MDLSKLVESKVTRTELLDCMIAEVSEELHEHVKTAGARVEQLKEFSFKDVSAMLKDVAPEVSVRRWTEKGKSRVRIEIEIETTREACGEKLQAHLAALEVAEKAYSEAREQLQRMHGERGALKTRLLRQMLQQSEEGKQLIEIMDGMKTAARKQLQLSAKGA